MIKMSMCDYLYAVFMSFFYIKRISITESNEASISLTSFNKISSRKWQAMLEVSPSTEEDRLTEYDRELNFDLASFKTLHSFN